MCATLIVLILRDHSFHPTSSVCLPVTLPFQATTHPQNARALGSLGSVSNAGTYRRTRHMSEEFAPPVNGTCEISARRRRRWFSCGGLPFHVYHPACRVFGLKTFCCEPPSPRISEILQEPHRSTVLASGMWWYSSHHLPLLFAPRRSPYLPLDTQSDYQKHPCKRLGSLGWALQIMPLEKACDSASRSAYSSPTMSFFDCQRLGLVGFRLYQSVHKSLSWQ